MDKRILRCIYDGTHKPVTDGWRHPIMPPMIAIKNPEPPAYAETAYYLIWQCRACGMEWREAHGTADSI